MRTSSSKIELQAMPTSGNVPKGVKDNNGIPDSDDVFLSDKPSTLVTDFAAVGCTYRMFEDDDLDAVRELFTVGMGMYTKNKPKESALYQFWWEYIDGALATDLVDAAAVKRVYVESGGGFWVVEDSAQHIVACVGFERLAEPQGTGELRRMSVAAAVRGSGLGKKLVRVVEEYASNNGFCQVVLTTGSIMVPAMKLYTSAGYEHWRKGFMPEQRREMLRASGDEDLYEAAFRKPITAGNQGRWMWNEHGKHSTTCGARAAEGSSPRVSSSLLSAAVVGISVGVLIGLKLGATY